MNERDRQIIKDLANGKTVKEVASRCGCTIRAVEWRLEKLRKIRKALNTTHLICQMANEDKELLR